MFSGNVVSSRGFIQESIVSVYTVTFCFKLLMSFQTIIKVLMGRCFLVFLQRSVQLKDLISTETVYEISKNTHFVMWSSNF